MHINGSYLIFYLLISQFYVLKVIHLPMNSVLLLLIALAQVQDFELSFVESHEAYNGAFIQSVKISLDGILSF